MQQWQGQHANRRDHERRKCPIAPRLEVWRRLASDMKPKTLTTIAREIPLTALPDAFATLASGNARGRFVVNVA